jgi:prepilin-type N-terminal cleavage/methylation domain-containing protein
MKINCPLIGLNIWPAVKEEVGFTLVELLVTISIFTILFTIGVAKYNQFNRRQVVKQAALNLKTNLFSARNKALAGEKDCSGSLDGYEVTFSSDSYTFRAKCGTNYGASKTVNLPGSVVINSSPDAIIFKVLGQGALIDGSPSIVVSGHGVEHTISVTTVGEIK